ncbi:MAG: C45 family autoproteolytic acyltransferase/hydrolase [Acidobacteriota bacterium]
MKLVLTRLARLLPLLLATLPCARAGASNGIALSNPGFEEPDGALAVPSGWSVDQAPASAENVIRLDRDVRRSGVTSLAIRNVVPASAAVTSEPVALEVGRLYRLSAWVKTQGALSDATSRYPTAVPACLTMASFPFTNHSPAIGADRDWTRVEVLFIATTARDRVRLHLGNNGTALGTAWFDDVEIDVVDDISELVVPETVRWVDLGFRFDDKGWIFVHIEGDPYRRGYQLGYLVADEIATYITKLATAENTKDPSAGWQSLRLLADSLLLRKYDEEYLTEMKGIADGAARAGAKFDDHPINLLDVVTVNSVVDLGQLKGGLRVAPTALTGRSFLSAEDEMKIPDDKNRCTGFSATTPATSDGRIVFGQIFMWAGYTGVHFNVMCDVVPTTGHRLVYQTFPGGIHSGTDFYINSAGIVIGETTVAQTPFDPEGTPQSNRIRKAAQYASSIDDVVRILREKNNGLYTNDWPIADIKTNEAAMYLLGTHKDKLWRSSDNPAPFGTPGFLWANNNARDPEVRKEYGVQPEDAPFDLVFSPWNRDVAFQEFYDGHKGKIDATAAVRLWASSPINRSHACDGKITTSEMAEKLVFLAHYGKVTLREKFPAKDNRRMPDLPGAIPHLSLGYSTVSPIFVADKMKELHARSPEARSAGADPTLKLDAVKDRYTVEKKRLWRGTMYPETDAVDWLISGSAAYWQMLNDLPEKQEDAFKSLRDKLADLNHRLLYVLSREDDLAPVDAMRVYDRYGPYQIPRIKGTFALHQLRLLLGNEEFLKAMDEVHRRYAGKNIGTEAFLSTVNRAAGRDLAPFVTQWIGRKGLPDVSPAVDVKKAGGRWRVTVEVKQGAEQYHLFTSVAVDAGKERVLKPIEIKGAKTHVEWTFAERPTRVVFDASNDIPVLTDNLYTWASYVDDFHSTLIVYGTSRQIEANHTLALRWQSTLADAYAEILSPVAKDCEVSDADLASHDLMLLGQPEDNSLVARIAPKLPVAFGKNYFRWRGKLYAHPDDGLVLVLPNPFNSKKVLYLLTATSALELYQMTKTHTTGIPSWAVYRGDAIKEQGYHSVDRFVFDTAAP